MMKRIALFFVMKVIGWFDLEVEVLDLLSPKPIRVVASTMSKAECMEMVNTVAAAAKKNLDKIKKELPKRKPPQKKKR